MMLKQALVKWAELEEANRQSQDGKEEMKISGKFKYETPDGKDPMVVFIPSRKELLSEATLKSPHRFNEAISSLFEVPFYLRTTPKLPNVGGGEDISRPPVHNQQCFNCGCYHHQVRDCNRPIQRRAHLRNEIGKEVGRGRGRGRLPDSNHRSSAGTGKRMRTDSGSFEGDKSRKTAGIPPVKIIPDSESDVEGLEDGEVIDRPKEEEPISRPRVVHAPKRQARGLRSGRMLPEVFMEDEVEEGEIVESLPVPPPPSVHPSVCPITGVWVLGFVAGHRIQSSIAQVAPVPMPQPPMLHQEYYQPHPHHYIAVEPNSGYYYQPQEHHLIPGEPQLAPHYVHYDNTPSRPQILVKGLSPDTYVPISPQQVPNAYLVFVDQHGKVLIRR